MEFSFINDLEHSDSMCNFDTIMDDLSTQNKTSKTVLNREDYDVEMYMYDRQYLSFIVDYIYPFWNAEFVDRAIQKNGMGSIPVACSTWSREDVVIQSMGLKQNSLCIHLVISDVPIGFCNILVLDEFDRYKDEHRKSMFSDDVYTDALFLYNVVLVRGFRGQGYGSAFVQDVFTTMKQQYENRYSKILLMVDRNNTGAQRLYERLGCIKVEEGHSDSEWMYEWRF